MVEHTLPTYAHELPQAQRLWDTVRKFRLDTGYIAPCMEWFPCVVMPSSDGLRLTMYFVAGYTGEGILLDQERAPVELTAGDMQTQELQHELEVRCTYTLRNFWGDEATLTFAEPHVPVHDYKGFYERTSSRIRDTLRVLTGQGYHTAFNATSLSIEE